MPVSNELKIRDQVNIVDATITSVIFFDNHVYVCLDIDSDTDPWMLITQSVWPLDWPPQKGDRMKVALATIMAVMPREHAST